MRVKMHVKVSKKSKRRGKRIKRRGNILTILDYKFIIENMLFLLEFLNIYTGVVVIYLRKKSFEPITHPRLVV